MDQTRSAMQSPPSSLTDAMQIWRLARQHVLHGDDSIDDTGGETLVVEVSIRTNAPVRCACLPRAQSF